MVSERIVKIDRCEVLHEVTEVDSVFWVNLYFPLRTKLWNEEWEEQRFCEFGFSSKNSNSKKDTEPCEWRENLIAEIWEDTKQIFFQYRVLTLDEEDEKSKEVILKQLSDNYFWDEIFDELRNIPLNIPKHFQEKVNHEWLRFKCKALIKEISKV